MSTKISEGVIETIFPETSCPRRSDGILYPVEASSSSIEENLALDLPVVADFEVFDFGNHAHFLNLYFNYKFPNSKLQFLEFGFWSLVID